MKGKFIVITWFILFSACASKKTVSDVVTVTPPEIITSEKGSFWMGKMGFKKVTPDMEVQVEELMSQGCLPEYKMLENETAYLYSLIPGAGQLYTGEPKKALMYALGSVLIVPYLISFEDAQSSVDYINIKYSIDYCKEKLRLSKQMKERAERKRLRLSKQMKERTRNKKFMDQITGK